MHRKTAVKLLRQLIVTGILMATDVDADQKSGEEIEKQNALEQAGALKQDPGGADRAKLLRDRLKDPIYAGLPDVRNPHPDAQWFGKGPMGLFIHWGIASADGDADLSWPMIMNMGGGRKIKPRDYWALAKQFKAENYDPNLWLKAAKDAGYDYAVLTAKHHDGYTLFPTDTTDMGVQTYLPGRDLVKDYVAACRANGLKVGLYYSGPEWYLDRAYHDYNYRSETGGPTGANSSLPAIPGRRPLNIDFEEEPIPPVPIELKKQMQAAARQQLTELLTRYGKIDLVWFDGGCGCDLTVEEIRKLQPGIVINNRGTLKSSATGKDWPGDYFTFEHGEPLESPPGWWEQLRIWNSPSWGYTKKNEVKYASTASILSLLAKTRAMGGALMTNTGPRPDGTMPDPFYKGMREVAEWMKINRESVVDVSPAPRDVQSNVPITVKRGTAGQTWYLHVLPTCKGEITVSPGASIRTIKGAKMLGGSAVPFNWDGQTVKIVLPPPEANVPHQVLAIEVD